MNGRAGVVGSILVFASLWTQPLGALPISGRVVDYKARPVAGAEVAVYEAYSQDEDPYGRVTGPVVRTDKQGCFAVEADVTSQRDTYVVARKEGLALAWDGLNYSNNMKNRGCFLLVLERPAELTGVVVDHAGNPVAGARVRALPKTSYHSRLRQRPMVAPDDWFTTQTDGAGRFRFDAFCADVSSDFWIKASGRASTYKFTTHRLNSCGFEVGRTDIRLRLPKEGKVTGRAVDRQTGEPVPNVPLVIRTTRDREDITNLYVPNRARSNAEGNFEFPGVPEGKHLVEVFVPSDETAEWAGLPVEIATQAGVSLTGVKVAVTKGGLIEVAVRGAYTGKALRHIRVLASQEEPLFRAFSSTDADGNARLRVLPGDYEVSAWGAGFPSWRATEPTSVADGQTARLEARLAPCDHVAGTVRDGQGTPAPGILVTVHPFGDQMYTDETGRFIAGVNQQGRAEGAWLIALDPDHGRAAAAQVVEKNKPVDLTLAPALTVTGRIADANDAPIPAARVALCALIGGLSDLGMEALTDPNGRFTTVVAPAPAGQFEYRASFHATDYAPKQYEKPPIEGKPGDTCDLGTITLLAADRSISGVVVDADGMPAPHIPIFLQGREGIDQPDKNTATDEQGRFRITRICKGPLRLQANFSSSPGGQAFADAEAGQQDIRIVLPGHLAKYNSLVGKPLPPLTEIAALSSLGDVENRAVLICFFDMTQRPSRHCLSVLATKAEELRQKQVGILAIQAADADAGALDAWARDQGIPFPVAIVKADITKVRYSWGVQSLPWLILADTAHVVQAEGFTIAELPRKLESIAQEE